MTIPETHFAVIHNPKTHALQLREVPVPRPSPDHCKRTSHLVEVYAASITHGELKWPEPAAARPHPIPAYDVAGIVVTAAEGSPFGPGDEVYSRMSFGRPGAASEYTVIDACELARKPEALSWEEAATVPLSALTAWQALFVHGGLKMDTGEGGGGKNGERKKRVLVTGGAGGVGIWVVQLAKKAGLHVVATCSGRNKKLVESLGADQVLDYMAVELVDWVGADFAARSFDVVVDCVGGRTCQEAWKSAREGGIVISVAEPPDRKRPVCGVAKDVKGVWFIVEASSSQLRSISALLDDKSCRAVVDSIWPLEGFLEAFERVESKHARGKVVLKIK